MQSYKILARYFTTGTAETETPIIDAAYVSTAGVIDIINPPAGSPRVLVGKKGSGKSIVLRFFKNRFVESGIPVLLLRPADIDTARLPADKSLGALILALRQIMERCQNVRCIVTLRAEVWIRLGRDSSTQRDQVDHIRELVHELNPTEGDVREIAERRFELARQEAALPHVNEHTKLFFEGTVILPDFDQTRSWYDFLVKRSRERPRDLVQLVGKLVKCADKDKARPDKIKATHAAVVVPIFSKERVDDLKREVEDECPAIEAIVRTFSSATYDIAGFSMTAGSLLKHLMRVPSAVPVMLYGKRLRQMDEENAFLLWKYLFDIGFLGARYADTRRPKGFTHKSVRDDSTLISKDRRQELDLVHWDINPAYRDFLHSLREVEFLGLPNRGAKMRTGPHEKR